VILIGDGHQNVVGVNRKLELGLCYNFLKGIGVYTFKELKTVLQG
jgi:hypothetical protein